MICERCFFVVIVVVVDATAAGPHQKASNHVVRFMFGFSVVCSFALVSINLVVEMWQKKTQPLDISDYLLLCLATVYSTELCTNLYC